VRARREGAGEKGRCEREGKVRERREGAREKGRCEREGEEEYILETQYHLSPFATLISSQLTTTTESSQVKSSQLTPNTNTNTNPPKSFFPEPLPKQKGHDEKACTKCK
jgi:hypothetical protein